MLLAINPVSKVAIQFVGFFVNLIFSDSLKIGEFQVFGKELL